MRTRYDPETDALDLRFADAPVVETEEVLPGVTFDFDKNGRILAIEVLDASERLNESAALLDPAATELDEPAASVRKRVDLGRLQALTATMLVQAEDAASFVRAMRDGDRF